MNADRLFRCLLALYAPEHRSRFGPEMLGVLRQAEADHQNLGTLARLRFARAESLGLIRGAAVSRGQAVYTFARRATLAGAPLSLGLMAAVFLHLLLYSSLLSVARHHRLFWR